MSLISFLEGGIADAFGENNHNSTTPRKTPSGAASSSDAPSVVNASGAKSAITLSTTAATTSSTALASQQDRKLKHDEIQMSLSIQWATGCILTKQFAVSLVQTCPNGAHDLKTIFFSDFDHYLARRLDEKAGQSQSAKDAAAAAMGGSIASKSRWKKVARKRGELVAAMTGVLDAEGGDFIARDDQTSRVKAGKMLDVGMLGGSDSDDDETGGNGRRFAKLQQTSAASQTATHSHFSNFLNVANGLLTRKTARTLVFLDAPQFVLRALKVMCLLDVVPQHFSDDIESLEINEMLAALRWRQVDGLGLRAPMSETEQASDYLSDDDDPASKFRREDYDADGYFKIVQQRDRRRSQRWEREVRERWYSLRELLAVEGQLQYFTRLPILTFALYDLFLGANHRRTTTNTVHWNDVVEYLGDCSGGSGGDNDAKGATAGGAAPTTSDTAARAMREAIHTIAFPDVNRAAVIIPWLSRGVIIALEIDRKEQETLSMFDSSVLRPNRAHVWPQHFGKISHVAVCTELQAMIVATFDVVRVIDGDNYVVKFMHRVEEPITALQWIEESSMLVVGTRAGSVEVFRLRNLDTWFFGCGSRVVTSVPSEDNFLNKKLHSDAITTVGQRVLPGTTILTASMDCSLTSWSLESNVVRRVVGAVALGFEALPSLALVFAYGVELFPMLWSYTVANSKPIILGGAKKGIRPHQARIIGVALLSHPKNSGCSIDRLGGVKVWDLWEQGLLQSWCAMDHIPPGLNTRGLTFQNFFVSPNGRELTIVSSRMFHKIELMKAEDARRAPIASNAPVHALAHCPELRLFVSAQRNSVTIWNAVTAAPITTYEDVSRVPGDEILSMKVYESPNREIRLGTKCGCVITMSLGNGSIKNVYRHASHKDIQCFVFVPVLELLVLSCEKSAKSVVPGDEKSFVLPQKTALGFADVCIHHTTMLLIAAHDDEVRCTVWDASPTTPNLWIRLCDVTIPTKYLDRSLGSEGGRKDSVHHHDNGASPSPDRAASSETKEESLGLGTVVCALLEDFNGTAFFAMSDTTSQFYICQLIVQLDGKDISLGRNDHNSATDTTAEDNDDKDNDAKGGAGRRSTALEAASRRVAHRRKSTLFDKCVGVMHNIGVGEASVKPSGGTSTAISNDGPRAAPMLGNAGKKDVARKVSIVVRQIAPHRLHATNNTGASLPPGKVDQDVIPTITSIRYLNAFALLYIADDLGRVSIYDIAGVLLQSTQSLASSPSAPHLTPQASMSLASGSSGNTVGTVSRGRPMMKTTSTVTTNFKNTRPQSIHDLVLAEQIWGKTDLPFAVTLDDRIAEMGEVFQTFTTKQSSVSQATKERNRKRREQHGGESAADGPSETGLNSAPSAGGNELSWGASRESNPLSEAKTSDSAESKSDFLICIESQSGAFSSDDFTPPSMPMDSHHAVISPNPAPPLPQFIPSLAGGAGPASVIAPSGLHVKVDVREGSSLKVDLGATARFQGSVVNSGGGPPHTSGGTFGDMSVTSRAATMKFQNAHRVKLGPPPPVAETPKHNSSVVTKASSFGTAIPDLNNSSNRMLELFIPSSTNSPQEDSLVGAKFKQSLGTMDSTSAPPNGGGMSGTMRPGAWNNSASTPKAKLGAHGKTLLPSVVASMVPSVFVTSPMATSPKATMGTSFHTTFAADTAVAPGGVELPTTSRRRTVDLVSPKHAVPTAFAVSPGFPTGPPVQEVVIPPPVALKPKVWRARSVVANAEPPPPDVVQLEGSVYLVHVAVAHPNHAIPSLIILDSPLVSIATCGKDHLISLWTLFMKPIGRLALSVDARLSLYAKFEGMKFKGAAKPSGAKGETDPLSLSTSLSRRQQGRRNRGVVRRKSCAPPHLMGGGSTMVDSNSGDMEELFGNSKDRLSVFDDVPRRFRFLERSPVSDWEFEMDRVNDVAGDTMGGGGAVDAEDAEEERAEAAAASISKTGGGIAAPMRPILCDWEFLVATGLGGDDRPSSSGQPAGGGADERSILANLDASPIGTPSGNSPTDTGPTTFFLTATAGDSPRQQPKSTARKPKKRLPKKTAERLRLTHEQKVSMFLGWCFGKALNTSATEGRSVDRILALKQMGQTDLDDVVNDILLAKEDAEEAENARRLKEAEELTSFKMTREMKLLFGSTEAQGDSVIQRPASPELILRDGELLDATDERLASPDRGYDRCDEAWLSRVVLKHMEPKVVVLPVPTTTKIENMLERKRTTTVTSPPALARRTAERVHNIDAVVAQCNYKDRVNAWELMTPDERWEDLETLEHMPHEEFDKRVMEPSLKQAREDVKSMVVQQRQIEESRLTRTVSSLPPIMSAMATRQPQQASHQRRSPPRGPSSTLLDRNKGNMTRLEMQQSALQRDIANTSGSSSSLAGLGGKAPRAAGGAVTATKWANMTTSQSLLETTIGRTRGGGASSVEPRGTVSGGLNDTFSGAPRRSFTPSVLATMNSTMSSNQGTSTMPAIVTAGHPKKRKPNLGPKAPPPVEDAYVAMHSPVQLHGRR